MAHISALLRPLLEAVRRESQSVDRSATLNGQKVKVGALSRPFGFWTQREARRVVVSSSAASAAGPSVLFLGVAGSGTSAQNPVHVLPHPECHEASRCHWLLVLQRALLCLPRVA